MAAPTENSDMRVELATMPLVLMYHSVSPYDEDPHEVTITPERFERHLLWLAGRGLRGVSMAELLSARARGHSRGLVGLTFDDGYQDFVTHAMPLLQQYGCSATVFVLAGRLGGHNAWDSTGPYKALLTADQVCLAAESGMEIASHGLDHVSLAGVDDTQLSAETVHSRAILQELTRRQIHGFAYPWGHLDARAVKAVQAAGYDYACAVGPTAAIGRYSIPRTAVFEHDSSWRLDAKRIRSALTVGNRLAVRRHRGNARSLEVGRL
jgi:peptidoglycan/xylan/chitin deacetylase (PgdA/CDA1 family)